MGTDLVVELEQTITDAYRAIKANDYSTAHNNALAAEMILAGLPNMTRGANGVLFSDRITAIRQAVGRLRGARSQTVKIEYGSPTG